MGKKSILMWAMAVLMVIVGSGIAEEKKSKGREKRDRLLLRNINYYYIA